MPADPSNGFQSVLSACMEKFLQEKHACGYAYREPTRVLRQLDKFLMQEGLATCELPASIARKWLAKKAHERAGTQQHRITVTRQFSRFLFRLGYSAYVPDSTLAARNRSTFVPRMLTDGELRKFFQAVDALKPTARSPLRHFIMPEVFRLLYGCGFRVGEVLKLRVRDVTVLKLIVGKKIWRDWNLRLPEIPFNEQRYFTTDEMVQIINAAKGQNAAETLQWRTLFASLAGTGLRCGEVFGLHVADLDLNNRRIHVRRSVYQQNEVSVKTKKRYRVVHVEAMLAEMLRQHLGGRTSGRVFQTRNGTPFSKDNVRRKLHFILDSLRMKHGGLHAFLHGRVSFLRKNGVADKIINDWIGHSTLRMADLYTHFEDADRQQVANDLGALKGVCPLVPSVIVPNVPKSSEVAGKGEAA